MDIHSVRRQMGIWGSVVYRVGDGGLVGVLAVVVEGGSCYVLE